MVDKCEQKTEQPSVLKFHSCVKGWNFSRSHDKGSEHTGAELVGCNLQGCVVYADCAPYFTVTLPRARISNS